MSSKPGTSIGFLQPHNHRSRVHSNTVSGDRPPAIDTSITPPPSTRRNSEGSPRLPVPPINISSPSPVVVTPSSSSSETLSLQRHFPDTDKMPPPAVQNETTIIQTNGKPTSRSPSPKPPPPVVAPEPQPSLSSRFLAGQRKSRSRGSSVSTMQSTSESPDRADLQTAASSEKSLALLGIRSDMLLPPDVTDMNGTQIRDPIHFLLLAVLQQHATWNELTRSETKTFMLYFAVFLRMTLLLKVHIN